MARWLTVDPGSKMASGEPRVLQDDHYKTSGSHERSGVEESLFRVAPRKTHLSTPSSTGTIQEEDCMQDDPRSQEEELLTSMDQVTLAKFVECFPFLHHEHLPG